MSIINKDNENTEELDNFFNRLTPLLPEVEQTEAPEISQDLLDQAWQGAQAHFDYLWARGLYSEKITVLAANDGEQEDKPFIFYDLQGDWNVSRYNIPNNTEFQILRFECNKEFIKKYQGKRIEFLINKQTYNLGAVMLDGIAKTKIPYGLDMGTLEAIFFKNNDEK